MTRCSLIALLTSALAIPLESLAVRACGGSSVDAPTIAWPPLLLTGKTTAGTGLTDAELGTIARSARNRQVSYDSHPLYLYTGVQRSR
jgi:predicted lipoprotein with Yx(FWY)xxD motif